MPLVSESLTLALILALRWFLRLDRFQPGQDLLEVS
jgi:hypothetical protein